MSMGAGLGGIWKQSRSEYDQNTPYEILKGLIICIKILNINMYILKSLILFGQFHSTILNLAIVES